MNEFLFGEDTSFRGKKRENIKIRNEKWDSTIDIQQNKRILSAYYEQLYSKELCQLNETNS